MKRTSNILWGIVLIVIGLIIGGNVLGITDIDLFFDGWWTLFIIVPCFIGLFKEKEKKGNIIGLTIGTILLLSCQGVLEFEMIFKLLIPAILVAIGISMISKETIEKNVSIEIKNLNEKRTEKNEYCATFSGQDIKFDGQEFNGADLTAVFGGIECDLRKAVIHKDVVINTSSIFGGIDIFVPDNVKIKVKSTSIFGGVSNKKKHVEMPVELPIVYINALCLFGGVDIK